MLTVCIPPTILFRITFYACNITLEWVENMDASSFWNVIAQYNIHTIYIQAVLLTFMIVSIIAAYVRQIYYLPKIALGVCCLFIGFVFFLYYGTEPIQHFFAAPLFIACGLLFIYEAKINKADVMQKPNKITSILLVIVLLYPLISYMLGNVYPSTVLLIMPCPIISLCILIYSCYIRRNRLLMVLLIIWGMTGIKSLFFNAYEDLILLICGFYGIYLIIASKDEKARSKLTQ